MLTKSFITIVLTAGVLLPLAADYYCKYCGDKFSNPDAVRYGLCLHSGNKKHTVISCQRGHFACEQCGDRFSDPTAVRYGHCLRSSNHKHTLSGGSGSGTRYVCRFAEMKSRTAASGSDIVSAARGASICWPVK